MGRDFTRLELRWRDALLTGDEGIDRQHRAFFDDAQAIAEAMRRPAGMPEVLSLVARFHADQAHHFAHEEAVLEATGYPDLAEHRAEHRALLGALDAAEALLLRSRLPDELVAVVEHMLVALVGHVLSFDMRYRAWLTGPR